MQITIYRGTKEIGGTLVEIKTPNTRILVDTGYPLFLNSEPIESNISRLPYTKLLELGVLPAVDGLYAWDFPGFDGVLISHAHLDHYGLLKYVHPLIPIFMSAGTEKLIQLSRCFKITDDFNLHTSLFDMYQPFQIGDVKIRPYLMDHSAFDSAAFEIITEDKTIVYSGDFRAHGRKAKCLDRFIELVKKRPDLLLVEGSMLGRLDEHIMTEAGLENLVIKRMKDNNVPLLFQCSSQNIDRLVSLYRAAIRLKRLFVIDVYTANVLYELKQLGNKLPFPSPDYPNIKVFYPYYLTRRIFNKIGQIYARRFSDFHISREQIKILQGEIVMACRPSMLMDIKRCKLHDGVFLYSMWQGYRDDPRQRSFEKYLEEAGFSTESLHTSGHAGINDIQRIINEVNPKKVIPIHTLYPEKFYDFSTNTELKKDGVSFTV